MVAPGTAPESKARVAASRAAAAHRRARRRAVLDRVDVFLALLERRLGLHARDRRHLAEQLADGRGAAGDARDGRAHRRLVVVAAAALGEAAA